MKDFIKIKEIRIRKTTIKKYSPSSEIKLNVYFSVSRYKVELETFTFKTTEERNGIIQELDNIFVS